MILFNLGIAVGRFTFVGLARRIGEARIILICLAFSVFLLPGLLLRNAWVYVPSFFLLGLAFSAPWPAFFALATRSITHRRSEFTMMSGLFSLVGVTCGILLASAVGNTDAGLPWAVLVSAGTMAVFALYLFASPWGRRLMRTRTGGELQE